MLSKWKVYQTLARVGLGRAAIQLEDHLTEKYEFTELVDQEVRSYSGATDEGYVLIPLTRGQDGLNSFRYCILAHAFRTRGYTPIIPLCHADLDLCQRKTCEKDGKAVCDVCNYAGQSLLSAFGLKGTPIDSLLGETYSTPEVNMTLETYRGISVSDYAMSSTRRFLLRHSIDFEDSHHRETYLRFLRSAVTLVDVCEALFEQYPFDAVLAHDDRYVHGGIYLAVAQKHGVTSYSHALGRREGTILFGDAGNRSSLPFFTDHDTLETELERPLTASEKRRVEEIMTNRTTGSDVRINYSARTNNSFDSAADSMVGIFTNLIWDASLEVKELVFPDVLAWIDDTIEHVADVDGVQFLLKTHPAEAKFGTKESVEQRIRSYHAPLPDNLEILSPDTEIDTYALISDLDAGIVYNSTVGLEMAYEGVPTIVAGDTHYRNLKFTFDPETQDEYFSLLHDVRELEMNEEMTARAKRYVYLYFERKHIDFPFFKTRSAGDNEYLEVEHDNIKPGNENFDLIARKILADEPVLR